MRSTELWRRPSAATLLLLVLAATPASAEVMDKEPSQLMIWTWAVVASGIVYWVGRRKGWLALILLPVGLLLPWAIVGELLDPHVGSHIVREAGWSYVVSVGLSTIMMVVAFAAGVVSGWRRRRAVPLPAEPYREVPPE